MRPGSNYSTLPWVSLTPNTVFFSYVHCHPLMRPWHLPSWRQARPLHSDMRRSLPASYLRKRVGPAHLGLLSMRRPEPQSRAQAKARSVITRSLRVTTVTRRDTLSRIAVRGRRMRRKQQRKPVALARRPPIHMLKYLHSLFLVPPPFGRSMRTRTMKLVLPCMLPSVSVG